MGERVKRVAEYLEELSHWAGMDFTSTGQGGEPNWGRTDRGGGGGTNPFYSPTIVWELFFLCSQCFGPASSIFLSAGDLQVLARQVGSLLSLPYGPSPERQAFLSAEGCAKWQGSSICQVTAVGFRTGAVYKGGFPPPHS